jgi:molybdate transport system substrate-binding protein
MYKYLRSFLAPALLIPVLLAASGCGQAGATINLSASIVLSDALTEINLLYIQANPGIAIVPNFTAAGTIQQQIENGAPCDVFIAAAPVWMDNLHDQGLIIEDTRQDLVGNSLVLVVPAESSLNIGSFNDLTGSAVHKVAIGDPGSVSAGTYAKQTFDLLNLYAALQFKLVLGGNVRQVLTYVETGDVDAGLVFATDALSSSKVKAVADAPAEINSKIVYPAAVVKASKDIDAAKKYLEFLSSEAAKAIFIKYGFSIVQP